eukprot:TRINITY_DN1828_c2_g1_i1.p1 TRINITY_DN1828_c2_g1~~TRINITY_DN1828_c2_g1_i1.p1  ORF type:complete len:195 (+),score=40.84 TRINITY_DN1828_c2_g1_i1:201-785(+)
MGGSVLQTLQGCSPVMDAELLVDDVAGKDHGSTDDGWGSMSSSDDSIVLSSTLDFSDDGDDGAMSSSSSSSMTLHPSPEVDSNGPLYELSQLLVHLPIKRGLSRHYQGKSQSFTSLSNASCIEDLAKKSTPCSRKMMKSCKSYGGFLDCQKSFTPRACTRTISKKASKSSSSYLLSKKSRYIRCRTPISVQETL